MEKVLSADYQGSTRTSTFGDLDSRSSVALSDERLEELSEEALEAYYDRLQKSVKTLKIENIMLERFSERVDPSIMTYINQSLSHHSPQAHSSPVSSSHMSLLGKRSSIDSVTSTHTIGTIRLRRTGSTMTRGGAGRISKLTLPQKMNILMREMELVSISMEKSKEKWKITCKQLNSEIEEAMLRFESARIAKEELEEGFSQKWIDPITGQVPAEKYLRYIKEKIRLGERSIEKHRLKSSTLLLHYNRTKQQLHHKEELHEGLTAVDFEQNSIINNELKKSLEKKNQYFIELKKIVGKCNLELNEKRKDLWKKTQELSDLKKCITEKEDAIEKLNNDIDRINDEIELSHNKRNKLKRIISEYQAPSVLDYIKKKAELESLLRQKESLLKRVHARSQSNKDIKEVNTDNLL